jgi:penicillin-binding protein 2
MVIPRDIKDLNIPEFCALLNIARRLRERVAKAKVYSPRLPSVFLSQLNKNEFLPFQEKIRKFEGFIFKTFTS